MTSLKRVQLPPVVSRTIPRIDAGGVVHFGELLAALDQLRKLRVSLESGVQRGLNEGHVRPHRRLPVLKKNLFVRDLICGEMENYPVILEFNMRRNGKLCDNLRI